MGDLNSQVALYCTLLVAGSGVLGRYFYAGIHHGLYGSKATLQDMVGVLEKSVSGGHASALIEPIREELVALDKRVLAPSVTVMDSIIRHLTISWQTRLTYSRLMSRTRRALMTKAMTSAVVDQHADRLEATIRKYLREHLSQVRQVARFNCLRAAVRALARGARAVLPDDDLLGTVPRLRRTPVLDGHPDVAPGRKHGLAALVTLLLCASRRWPPEPWTGKVSSCPAR